MPTSMLKVILPIISVAVIIALFSGVFSPSWIAFYYPDKDNLYTYKHSEPLKSLEECRIWVQVAAAGNTKYDYECGKSCRYDKDFGGYICKETVK